MGYDAIGVGTGTKVIWQPCPLLVVVSSVSFHLPVTFPSLQGLTLLVLAWSTSLLLRHFLVDERFLNSFNLARSRLSTSSLVRHLSFNKHTLKAFPFNLFRPFATPLSQ